MQALVGAVIANGSRAIGSLAAVDPGKWKAPSVDYQALLPEIVLAIVAAVILLVDLFVDETRKSIVTKLAGVGVALTGIPVLVLAVNGHYVSMFGGAYVVDRYSLLLKGIFLLAGYIVLLLSANYLNEGDYYEGEYSFLLVCSLFGMLVMSSARDLITIFVALEMLSIPAYMLAGWRKRDSKSNEASIKYYLMGVIASTVMLYGMSLVYGLSGSTILSEINGKLGHSRLSVVAIFLVIAGFAFKVSAVPFHSWAPDTYEGAPTPITAFLSVASKAAGFVALTELVFVGFLGHKDAWQPLFWGLAVATMFVGNMIALRQTNIVRMLAYSSIAQAGFILAPLAVAGSNPSATKSSFNAISMYLLVYTLMNLGAFAVVIVVARKTRSGEISSFGGLFTYAPFATLMMTLFMFSLAGIPPLGGFWAKFYVFKALMDAHSVAGTLLAVFAAVNSVIAFYYYASIMREMWMRPTPDGDHREIAFPPALAAAIVLCALGVVVLGVFPSLVTHLIDSGSLLR